MNILFSLLGFILGCSTLAYAKDGSLILKKSGTGHGWVCVVYDGRDDCRVDDAGNELQVPVGDYAFLRATPEPGSHFVHWLGACRGQQQTCRLLGKETPAGQPMVATAQFSRGSAKLKRPLKKSKIKPKLKTKAKPKTKPKK